MGREPEVRGVNLGFETSRLYTYPKIFAKRGNETHDSSWGVLRALDFQGKPKGKKLRKPLGCDQGRVTCQPTTSTEPDGLP